MVAVAFDFASKRAENILPAEMGERLKGGAYCWLDINELGQAPDSLAMLGIHSSVIDRVLRSRPEGQFQLSQGCVHCILVEPKAKDEALSLESLHLILGENFLVTLHSHYSPVIEGVKQTYAEDFVNLAESGGFLLFEIIDHLIALYRDQLSHLSRTVDNIQKNLLSDVGDEIFSDVSELTRSLLDYRNAAVSSRETIDELATRRSPYVSASTQPFLGRQTVSLERLASDAATERTVLSEALALYMGIVSHRTNKVVNRLTVVSMVFLPLNFLAAVYGMNFEDMPELGWSYGYLAFWIVTFIIVSLLVWRLRRQRWL